MLLAVSIGLGATRATLHSVRQDYKIAAVESNLVAKTQELKWEQRLSLAQGTYLDTLKNLSTLKDESDEDTRAFAKTPAGAVDCLSLDRVRSALAYRYALEAAASSERGSGEVSPGSDTAKGSERK